VFPDKMAAGTIAELEKAAGVKAATNGCVNGLLTSMEQAGIDCSVIMPVVTAPRQFSGINRFAHSINEAYENGDSTQTKMPQLISFGGIHPESDDYKAQLEELYRMGFIGIKLHPDYQGVFFDDIRYKRIVSYASELDMIILVHAGIDIGLPKPIHCTPDMAAEVLKETQAPKLVLAHMGGWQQWDRVEELLIGSDAYLDMAFTQSYIEETQLYRMIQNHGTDKILFATDSPWSNQKAMVEWLQGSSLPAEAKKQIFEENACRLLWKRYDKKRINK